MPEKSGREVLEEQALKDLHANRRDTATWPMDESLGRWGLETLY